MITAPVLLLTFNRPKHLRQVLTEVLKADPSELYVFQDGVRDNVNADKGKCEEVRRVLDELVSTYKKDHADFVFRFRQAPHNLGCGAGPATGITWFFENVESGIVMEDDCLPHPDFFGYCEELLERYKDTPQVRVINSTLYHDRWRCEASYGFSRYFITGAWAAWRRTWEGFDLDLRDVDACLLRHKVKRLTKNTTEANWWYFKTLEIQRDKSKKSYWDFQLQVQLFMHDAITLHPAVNLISNIGFDAEGTHTLANEEGHGERKVFPILPLRHPSLLRVDLLMDEDCFAKKKRQSAWKDWVDYLYHSLLFSRGFGHRLLMAYKRIKHGRIG